MGRHRLRDEVDLVNLANLSYKTLIRALKSETVPEETKIDIATKIMCKWMPKRMEHSFDEDIVDKIIRLPAKKEVGEDVSNADAQSPREED